MIAFIGELVGGLVSVLVGLVLGTAVMLVVRLGRWSLLGSDRSTVVTGPLGERHTVRIALAPHALRFWL